MTGDSVGGGGGGGETYSRYQDLLYELGACFPISERFHWSLRGHMTSNTEMGYRH